MTKDELISKAGPARTFTDDVSVVLLEHALSIEALATHNAAARDALYKVKAELAALLVRLEQVAL